jgi:hypothetical protein
VRMKVRHRCALRSREMSYELAHPYMETERITGSVGFERLAVM